MECIVWSREGASCCRKSSGSRKRKFHIQVQREWGSYKEFWRKQTQKTSNFGRKIVPGAFFSFSFFKEHLISPALTFQIVLYSSIISQKLNIDLIAEYYTFIPPPAPEDLLCEELRSFKASEKKDGQEVCTQDKRGHASLSRKPLASSSHDWGPWHKHKRKRPVCRGWQISSCLGSGGLCPHFPAH